MAIEQITHEEVFQFAFETLQTAVTTIDAHTSHQPTRNAMYAAMFGTASGMLESLLEGLADEELAKQAAAAHAVGTNLLVAETTEETDPDDVGEEDRDNGL